MRGQRVGGWGVFRSVCLPVFSVTAAAAPPGDPDFALQWGLHNTGQAVDGGTGVTGADIGALEAWELHTGGTLVTVAIVASGVNPHPEFADRLLEGMAFGGADPHDSRDAGWIGTHMAGVIAAAHDGLGIAGIHPHVRILPVRVLGASPYPLANAVTALADAGGVDIIVFGHQFYEDNEALRLAIEHAHQQDILLIAPVGHISDSQVAYPARYPQCIAVAPTTMADGFPSWANHGPEVDLSAPGELIWSTLPGGGYGLEADNSSAIAAAYVGGVASLLMSYDPGSDVRQTLIDTADDVGPAGLDPRFGYGRTNAGAALGELAPGPPRFELTWNLPATLSPGEATTRPIRIVGGPRIISPASAAMIYRVLPAGVGVPIPMQWVGGDDYVVTFPPVVCGAAIEYYLSATAQGGYVLTDPPAAPLAVRGATSVAFETLLADDFEADLGWETETIGTETRGSWVRVAPVQSALGAVPIQPGYDRTPNAGRKCFVTAQHVAGSPVGTSDVDGGPVHLLSPIMTLTTADAEISYARWFVTREGTPDKLRVEFSRDGGGTWTLAEEVGGTPGWEYHTFRLSEFGAAGGNQLRLRFTTSDTPLDSLTEAAIDEVHVRAITCGNRLGDSNGDGAINAADWTVLADCLLGPGADISTECWEMDLFGDGRADLRDGAVFQNLVGTAPK